jgi:hypothetical protein
MPSYRCKDDVDLVYDANKTRLRVEAQILLDEAMNEALNEMTQQFIAGLGRGELLEIGGTQEEMQQFLRVAVNRRFGQR